MIVIDTIVLMKIDHFNEAYERYNYHNSFVNKKGLDYVKLFAYINEDIGLVLIGDFKPII